MSQAMSHTNSECHYNVDGRGSEGQGQGHGRQLDEDASERLDQIQLKWTSHQPTIFNIFQDLYNSENLVDVTLAAGGKYLRAHKIILSACSPYFQELLSLDCSTKHPILFMSPEVKFHELKAILNYMYKGEARIPQEDLPSLLRLAESLQIRGLAETKKPASIPAPPGPQQWSRSVQGQHSVKSPTKDKSVGCGGQGQGQGYDEPQHQNVPEPTPIITSISSISNQLDISTSPTSKRLRLELDPISVGNSHQNVEPIILRTSYNEPQLYSSQEQRQEIPQVNNVNMVQTVGVGSHNFEMEDIQIIEEQEVKVEMDGLIASGGNVLVGLLDESNSCGRTQSADEEFDRDEEGNSWNMQRSGGQHSRTDFQIPSTSSSYQGQLDRDTEDDSGDGGLEMDGRHNILKRNKNDLYSEEDGVFQCPNCPKSYTRKNCLARHMLNHRETTFICPLCSLQFSNPDKLRYHLKSKHPTYSFGRITTTQ